MSQKATGAISETKPPPLTTPVMQPRPPTALPRTPWMSHVVRGRPMLNMPPYYHMIHVPSPLAIVNTQSMFMPPPAPNMRQHSGDGAHGGCMVAGCPSRTTLPASHACEDSSDASKTVASSSASGPIAHDVAFLKFQKNAQLHGIKMNEQASMNPKFPGPSTHDVAFLKFQKNAQLHGIKISSTTKKIEPSGSPSGGRLSVASPEFTPHGSCIGSGKALSSPDSLRPDVIVISSDDDEGDMDCLDAISLSKDADNLKLKKARVLKTEEELQIKEEIQTMGELQTMEELQTKEEIQAIGEVQRMEELETMEEIQTLGELHTMGELHSMGDMQAMGVTLTVNGANYSESFLTSELLEVEGQVSRLVSEMLLNSDGEGFCIDDDAMCPLCSRHREMVSTSTQTEFATVEADRPQMINKSTATEDLKTTCDQETITEQTAAAAAVASAASVNEKDESKQRRRANEKSEELVNVSERCLKAKVPSLDTIDDSTSEEEMELSREDLLPQIAVKSETNCLTSEAILRLVKQECSDDLRHRSNEVSGKQDGQNISRISKTNSLTINTSSGIVHEDRNAFSGELDRWERTEKSKAKGITSSASSIAIRKDYHDVIYHQPSDFRDECRRRNAAAVEVFCEMFETDEVAGDAVRAQDSVTNAGDYMTELNIKCPEGSQSRGLEAYSRRSETVPKPAFCDDPGLAGGASSTTRLNKLSGSEERNDLSYVSSRSGPSSVDNCSTLDVRRQQKGPSSSHSNASARPHKNRPTSSRNQVAGTSCQETICTSATASAKGRDDNVSRSESAMLQKAYNACPEKLDAKQSFGSLLEYDCNRNMTASADDESLSSSENMSVAMSVSRAELNSDCLPMANPLSQVGLAEPSELMDMIKNQLLLCDPALVSNPQVLETLAVQQLYLMHQEQMVLSQMMEAMRQHQQPQQMMLFPQQAAQQVLNPQQLLLQQQLLAQQQLAQSHLLPTQQLLAQQQQLAQSQLLPTQQFVMLPPTSNPQEELAPRFAARFQSQGRSCAEVPTSVHSSIPETSHHAGDIATFHMGTFAEDSQSQKRSSSQDYNLNHQSHVDLRTAQNQESVLKTMDNKEQERSLSSLSKCFLDTKDNNLTKSAGNGLSEVLPASQGKRASSVSSKAASAFHSNGERSESAVTSAAMPSRSAAFARRPDSLASLAGSGNGKPFDRKVTNVSGGEKSFFSSLGVGSEFAPTVPVSSAAKSSYFKVFASEKSGPPVSETAESKPSDQSFGVRGRGITGGGIKPRSVAKMDDIQSGATADPERFGSQKLSKDSVNFNTGESGKEKLHEVKQSNAAGCPITRGSSATDQFAKRGDSAKNPKVCAPEKAVVRNRFPDGPPLRRTSVGTQPSEEDWGEAGSATWIKNPVHYGPPKCSATRVRPKTDEEW